MVLVTNKSCSVDGCSGQIHARGLCHQHYQRSKRQGEFVARKTAKVGEPEAFLRRYLDYSGSDCVLWPFGLHTKRKGYGQATVSSRKIAAHRAMCVLKHGEPPFARAEAAHSCGNHLCVNPNHIRWATAGENAHDKITHGTVARGSKIGMSKLSEDQVRKILSDPRGCRKLSQEFGVRRQTINSIRAGKTWKHVAAALQ